jgi:hypothetical protein
MISPAAIVVDAKILQFCIACSSLRPVAALAQASIPGGRAGKSVKVKNGQYQ